MKISCSHSDKEPTTHCWGRSTITKRTEYQVLRVSGTFLSFMCTLIRSWLFTINQTPKRLTTLTGGGEVVAICSQLDSHPKEHSWTCLQLGNPTMVSIFVSWEFWIGRKKLGQNLKIRQIKWCPFRFGFLSISKSTFISAELQTFKSIPVHPSVLLASEQLHRTIWWITQGHFNSQF